MLRVPEPVSVYINEDDDSYSLCFKFKTKEYEYKFEVMVDEVKYNTWCRFINGEIDDIEFDHGNISKHDHEYTFDTSKCNSGGFITSYFTYTSSKITDQLKECIESLHTKKVI